MQKNSEALSQTNGQYKKAKKSKSQEHEDLKDCCLESTEKATQNRERDS
jgi:hypothetical protein